MYKAFNILAFVKAASQSFNHKSENKLSHLKLLNKVAIGLKFDNQEKMCSYFKQFDYGNVHLYKGEIRSKFSNWSYGSDWLMANFGLAPDDVEEIFRGLSYRFHAEQMYIFENGTSILEMKFNDYFEYHRTSGFYFPGFGLIRIQLSIENLVTSDLSVWKFPKYAGVRCFNFKSILVNSKGKKTTESKEYAINNIINFIDVWKEHFTIPLYIPEFEITYLFDDLIKIPQYKSCMTKTNQNRGILIMHDSDEFKCELEPPLRKHFSAKFNEPSIHRRLKYQKSCKDISLTSE